MQAVVAVSDDEATRDHKVFTSTMQQNESFLGIMLTALSGRALDVRTENISISECTGEKVFDVYPAPPQMPSAPQAQPPPQSQPGPDDAPEDIITCKDGFVLVLNTRGQFACVFDSSADTQLDRGWISQIIRG